jgi:hypothetical protein
VGLASQHQPPPNRPRERTLARRKCVSMLNYQYLHNNFFLVICDRLIKILNHIRQKNSNTSVVSLSVNSEQKFAELSDQIKAMQRSLANHRAYFKDRIDRLEQIALLGRYEGEVLY